MDAINRIFALFRLNYHNQYYAAFQHDDQLKQIKRLWRDSLSRYPIDLFFWALRELLNAANIFRHFIKCLSVAKNVMEVLVCPRHVKPLLRHVKQIHRKQTKIGAIRRYILLAEIQDGFFFPITQKRRHGQFLKKNFSIYIRKVFLGR